METLTHLPLERYRSRYTEFLQDWETTAFSRAFKLNTILPDLSSVVMDIQQGKVLDSIGRPIWCLKQMQQLLAKAGSLHAGKVYFSDFYHSGLDALAYSGYKFKAYAFCWAQTFDQFDFTVAMLPWMRPYELMAFAIYAKVFVAHPLLKELICVALPHLDANIEVVGLPFDSKAVKAKLDQSLCPADPIDVVYTSRWDQEKNPMLFIHLVEQNSNLKFAVCTGRDDLYGSHEHAVNRAKQLEQDGRLKIYRQLSKAHYYAILSRSKVLFNGAYQDWISYTLLEGLTFGCLPLYPNFRSFPDTLCYSEPHLYMPGNVEDATKKLRALLSGPPLFRYRDQILGYHDTALPRMAEIIRAD